MQQKIFESIFLFLTFLSFTATTYGRPWTSSSMEFFAFLSVIFLYFSIPKKQNKLLISPILAFTSALIFASIIFIFFQKTNEIENVWIVALYGFFLITYNNSTLLKEESFYTKVYFVIVAIGIFNVYVILHQHFALTESQLGIWLAPYDASHGRPYGNFGQPNLAATLLLTSFCCAICLHRLNKIRTSTLVLLALFLGCTLSLPASKTSFLCLLVLFIISIYFKDKLSCLLFLIIATSIFFIRTLTTSTRDLGGVEISTGRFELWLTLLDAISQSPWLGYGILNTRVAHFQSREMDLTPHNQVIGSAHNLLIDFFIWFGIPVGFFLTCFFLLILFGFLKRNHNTPHNIYLAAPLIIHSQLEFPLFYANFLLLFSFILNNNQKKLKSIRTNLVAPLLLSIAISLFILISFEYNKISKRFTELRFYNQNYENSKKPEPITIVALDATGGQYNYFLKDKINTEDELAEIISLTKSMPSFKNYSLIINYLRENRKNDEELNFWLKKANASFSVTEMKILRQ